jgi:hypothetical protein
VIEQLRAIQSEFDEIKSLSCAERRELRNKMKTSEATLQASVSVIGASDNVVHAIGRSAEDVLEIFSARQRWYAVESELR